MPGFSTSTPLAASKCLVTKGFSKNNMLPVATQELGLHRRDLQQCGSLGAMVGGCKVMATFVSISLVQRFPLPSKDVPSDSYSLFLPYPLFSKRLIIPVDSTAIFGGHGVTQ